jgi:ribosomal protein L21E
MTRVDLDWVREQLDDSGYDRRNGRRQAIGTSVTRLIETLNDMEWDDEGRATVIELFAHLARGHAVAPAQPQRVGRWVPYVLGDFPVNTTVRIKDDAYTEAAGERYNGMVGKVVGARNGKAVVQLAEEADTTGLHVEPELLLALVAR